MAPPKRERIFSSSITSTPYRGILFLGGALIEANTVLHLSFFTQVTSPTFAMVQHTVFSVVISSSVYTPLRRRQLVHNSLTGRHLHHFHQCRSWQRRGWMRTGLTDGKSWPRFQTLQTLLCRGASNRDSHISGEVEVFRAGNITNCTFYTVGLKHIWCNYECLDV